MSTSGASLPGRQMESESSCGSDDDEPSDSGPWGLPVLTGSCLIREIQIDLLMYVSDIEPAINGWLEQKLGRIVQLAGVSQGQLNLVVVDDCRMTELHEQYADHSGSTDVLTFDLRETEDQPLLADIVICKDRAEEEAGRRGHEIRQELLLYAVHGLLHLLGEDDIQEDDARSMHQREDELLVLAGVGPVYRERN